MDAVLAEDGQTYSRRAIQEWFDTGSRISPMLNVAIGTRLLPNRTICQTVDAFFPSADPNITDQAVNAQSNLHMTVCRMVGAVYTFFRR